MSNLNSIFDTLKGWPNGSALEFSALADPGVTLTAGDIVTINSRELAPVKAYRIYSDKAHGGTDPVPTAIGETWQVKTWATGTDGDIVECTALTPAVVWTVIVANAAGKAPTGTRVIVADTAEGGSSFATYEDHIMTYSGSAWVNTTAPVNLNKTLVVNALSLYNGNYYEYLGIHPTAVWSRAAVQAPAPAHFEKFTSGVVASAQADNAWAVIEGTDQFDGSFTKRVTCVKLGTGVAIKVPFSAADTVACGDQLYSNAGALAKNPAGAGMKWSVGLVIFSNKTSGATGYIIMAS